MISSKTVLITGATSGIGLSLYEKYLELGYNVITCGRDKEKLTRLTPKAIRNLCFDVNDHGSIEEAALAVDEIDLLILNAGSCQYIDDAKHFDGKVFRDVLNTNLLSMGALLESFLPKINQGGQLAFVSSSATIIPFPRAEAYGASKAGLDYLANSLRGDLKKENIAVCLIHPGFVKTPLTDKNTFSMPFMISAEQAAKRIAQGIEQRKSYLHFPKRLTLMLKLFSLLPQSFCHAMLTKES